MIIYIHRNMINGKVYIGQTKTTIERRSHTDGSGYKGNNFFWSAIQKYGWQNFSYAILETCSKEEVDNREKFWISFFNATNPEFGYNLMPGGRVAKDSSLKKNGVFCKETGEYFNSLSDAAEWGGLSRTSMNDITKQIEGRRISAGKHPITQEPLHWCFLKEDLNKPNRIRSSHNATSVVLLETGEVFTSIKKAAEHTSICYQSIVKSCNSKGECSIHKKDKTFTLMYLHDWEERNC